MLYMVYSFLKVWVLQTWNFVLKLYPLRFTANSTISFWQKLSGAELNLRLRQSYRLLLRYGYINAYSKLPMMNSKNKILKMCMIEGFGGMLITSMREKKRPLHTILEWTKTTKNLTRKSWPTTNGKSFVEFPLL